MHFNLRSVLPVFACALLAAAPGCRTDPSVALLETELRWMEDQYYALEEQYRLKCQELESCRLAHQARTTTSAGDDAEEVPAPRLPSSRRRGPTRPDQSPPLEVPQVEGVPDLGPAGASSPGVLDLPSPESSVVRPSAYHVPVDTDITEILLNQQLTGGYDRDGLPGDDGVMVVIEPRNAAKQFVPAAGEILIQLNDPQALTPGKKTFAQWKLTPSQAAAYMRRSLLGRGVHLELPWPSQPPKADEFDLEVSYRTTHGVALTALRRIQIDPPRDASHRWTPVSDADPLIDTGVESPPPVAGPSGERPTRLPQPEIPSRPLPQNSSIDGNLRWAPQR